ncbi:protein hook homolog [Tribolium madens]|uniref:protein hook homolog n=1 Tax=Tribolium madens TaxID=41895 RepID=UPI001CF75268|nr:protein hook homolog [Tribolium madens]
MFRSELQDDGDLRAEIFQLKKNLSNINTENRMLKVKIRKLQNEIIKKDKQIDDILDPRKPIEVSKILYERSASFVLNMKEKNDELLQILHEKDIIIRRLQNQLGATKLYSQPLQKQFQSNKYSDDLNWDNETGQIKKKVPSLKNVDHNLFNGEIKTKKNRSLSWTCCVQEAESNLIKHTERKKSSVKDQNYLNSRQTSSRKSSPESDLERIELLCESPHEEIQQLHSYFLEIIAELDHLKTTVTELQNDKDKTDSALKKENYTIDMLAKEVKNLRFNTLKSSKNCGSSRFHSADLVAKVYNNKNRLSNKSGKEKKNKDKSKVTNNKKKVSDSSNGLKFKHKNKMQEMKSVMVQVDQLLDDTECSNQCLYVERNNIIIKEKSPTFEDREDEYANEVFEEYDTTETPN